MKSCFTLFLVLLINLSSGQVTNISGIINSYAQVTMLGGGPCIDTVYLNSSSSFSINDTVLIIQMKGAVIDSTNTTSYGRILNYNNAGIYEFGLVKSVGVGFVELKKALGRTYSSSGIIQLVRVPHYNDVLVNGPLTAQPWNGSTGGVLVFTANSTVTLSANIDVSGDGYRGGAVSINYYTSFFNPYFCSKASGRGGDKGEGISTRSIPHEAGRGANANGGGGGNDTNTGAGGGGNGGAGGHGGNNFFSPVFLWGDSGRVLDNGITSNKLFLGGGGGGGHQNNSLGSSGGNGGGIVIIKANAIDGNGFGILSNGINVAAVSTIDGAGGGGAGGSILLDIQNFNGNLNLNARGGKGGDQIYIPQCHGNGGGGGGGVIKKNGLSPFPSNVVTSVIGGLKGTGQCNNTINDGTNGVQGVVLTNLTLTIPINVVANAGPDQSICSGVSVQIGSAASTGVTYSWNNGAGNVANPIVNPSITTTYILTASAGTTCPVIDTDTVTVIVLPSPVSAFTYSSNCTGLTVSFANNSTGSVTNFWSFGDGNTSNNNSPNHTYSVSGYYNVQLVVVSGNGCIDTLIQNIYVSGPLVPEVIATISQNNCNYQVSFFGDTTNVSSVLWDFGDGTGSNQINPVHTYISPGIYSVTLIGNNICGNDTSSISVTINPVLIPLSSFIADTSACSSIVEFTNNSVNGTSYLWDFGDGNSSGLSDPIHNYDSNGVYSVTLIASTICFSDTFTISVVIDNFNLPVSSFIVDQNFCLPEIIFSNTSLYYTSIFWNLGDGTSSLDENPIHTYLSTGNYQVMLITSNECGIDTIIQSISVNSMEPPVASFIFDIIPCNGNVYFVDNSENAISWNWIFGDGHSSAFQNPDHTYSISGSYEVILIINQLTGCADTSSQTIFIDESGIQGIFIPNAFTPNNDGKNDKFELKSAMICDGFSIAIFNRWGQEVFSSNSLSLSWDGTFNGRKAPSSVYFYILKSNLKIKSGTVALIR